MAQAKRDLCPISWTAATKKFVCIVLISRVTHYIKGYIMMKKGFQNEMLKIRKLFDSGVVRPGHKAFSGILEYTTTNFKDVYFKLVVDKS